jgi:ketosteroid isomerase-like protein
MSLDMDAFFRTYAERYMAGDVTAVADMYDAPFLAVRSGSPIHLQDRAAVEEHLAGLMAAYQAAGAAAAEIADINVMPQGDSALLATLRWNVRAADGRLIRDFRTSYQLVGPAPWRIVGYVNHDTVRPEPNGSNDIFVMDPDGGNLVQLTDDAAFDTFPLWSPDG